MLADLVEDVTAVSGVDSVMVVRNGYVVLDTVVYPFPEDTAHIIHSCTKSVTATLIGIAIDRGFLAGVDVPVVEVLSEAAPETVDELKASMTIEDLLTMSTGLDCRDSYLYGWEGIEEMMASDDWSAYVLGLPMVEEPGTRFEYCNGASYLLSAVLTEVTGMSASEFAAEVLFEPLGITDYVWPASPDGTTIGWGELMLRPADMAKIGYLYLRSGEWDGDQVVSEGWIETATTTHITPEDSPESYGYQWWIDDTGYVMALGFSGQYITVVPNHDLVVVFTSGLRFDNFERPERLTNDYVLGAIVSDDPLPTNPNAGAGLAKAVAAARSAPEPIAFELPEVAAMIDGARYEFRPNDFGNRWFVLSFGEDSASLRLDATWLPLSPVDIDIGLDGRFNITEVSGPPLAARGAWFDDDTFLIEYQVIGGSERGIFEFALAEEVASMVVWGVDEVITPRSWADRVG